MAEQEGQPTLLAVDVGLYTGLAEFDRTGVLLRYRSRHFPNRQVLKRRAYTVLRDLPRLRWLVLEGGGELADIWAGTAAKRGIGVVLTTAEEWRSELMFKREQRSGKQAKQHARSLAEGVIEWSGCKRPHALRHDAAEAILAGVWGCLQTGLLPELPDDLRRLPR